MTRSTSARESLRDGAPLGRRGHRSRGKARGRGARALGGPDRSGHARASARLSDVAVERIFPPTPRDRGARRPDHARPAGRSKRLRRATDRRADSRSRRRRAASDADADRAPRALVLTGEGTAFCAGADLNWMRRSARFSREENEADAGRFAAMLRALDELPIPTVARVNGACLGGGMGLISCCDIVVAADAADFGFTEVRLGIAPAVISAFVLPRIGASGARRYFLTGKFSRRPRRRRSDWSTRSSRAKTWTAPWAAWSTRYPETARARSPPRSG